MTYYNKRPYDCPEPRLFSEWCQDLGLRCKGHVPNDDEKISFDNFTIYPGIKLYQVQATGLYKFWRVYGDVFGEYRTIQEWLEDYNMELIEPTQYELNDLNWFTGWDEFMDFGTKTDKESRSKFNLWNYVRELLKKRTPN